MEFITRIKNLFRKENQRDCTIEWYGPEIYLKDKKYEQRNNAGNNRTNKIDADGSNNNNSEDENSGT